MTEPTERDREMAAEFWRSWFVGLTDNPTLLSAMAKMIAAAREEGRREAIEALSDRSKFLRLYVQSSLDGNLYRINSQGQWEITEL